MLVSVSILCMFSLWCGHLCRVYSVANVFGIYKTRCFLLMHSAILWCWNINMQKMSFNLQNLWQWHFLPDMLAWYKQGHDCISTYLFMQWWILRRSCRWYLSKYIDWIIFKFVNLHVISVLNPTIRSAQPVMPLNIVSWLVRIANV